METIDPIRGFLKAFDEELFQEIVVQRDPTGFWDKARIMLFETSIANFNETVIEFVAEVNGSPDLYDYFVTMSSRMLGEYYAEAALTKFKSVMIKTVVDPVFGNGITFDVKQMSEVQNLLLFMTVNRTRIALAMVQKRNAIAEESRSNRGGKGKDGN